MLESSMKVIKQGKYHTTFWFEEIEEFQTGIFVIERPDTYYMIDTYCGSKAVDMVLSKLKKGKRLIVINTHFHWDHIWGNMRAAKSGATIISHIYCKEKMIQEFDQQWEANKQYKTGSVQMKLPDLTFSGKYKRLEDGIV